MTNVIRSNKEVYNHWISFEKDGDGNNPSLEVSAYKPDSTDEEVVSFTIWGKAYTDRDNYNCQDSQELDLSLTDATALRDFLSDVIRSHSVE